LFIFEVEIFKVTNTVVYKNSILGVFKNHGQMYPTNINLNYNYGFGSLSGIFLALQVLTGLILASHYVSYEPIVFENLEHIMRDVNYGWLFRYMHLNGASFFFIAIYMHLFRGIYYKSYVKPRHFVWISGVLILLISILTAFIGYVLPWGQMSFWGATVITNLVTAVPLVGNKIVLWIWGNFTVSGVTLTRFFNFHYLMAIILLVLVLFHLIFLHEVGSSNPLTINSPHNDKIKSLAYFYLKDLLVLLVWLFLFFLIVCYFPNLLGHHYNYIRANPLVTPTHIVPEWYFLPFYAILRSFDNKLVGVIAMILSILSLILLPIIENKILIKNSNFLSIFDKFSFYFLVFTVLGLWWIGSLPAVEPYIFFGKMFTLFYIFFFFFLYASLQYNNWFLKKYVPTIKSVVSK
jgi:ubiquinol-cytochrome c reductase cytochrome b subunit